MTTVENIDHTGPVKVGFGIEGQQAALMTAGADRVFIWPEERDLVLAVAGAAVRPDDTLILVQPDAIPAADLRFIIDSARGEVDLQVIGNDPTRDLATFKAQTPKAAHVVVKARTGRPGSVEYTRAQANAIVRLWHEKPKRPPREVKALAETILGLEPDSLKRHWVRDLVIKYVGTARRDPPDDWAGISTDED